MALRTIHVGCSMSRMGVSFHLCHPSHYAFLRRWDTIETNLYKKYIVGIDGNWSIVAIDHFNEAYRKFFGRDRSQHKQFEDTFLPPVLVIRK